MRISPTPCAPRSSAGWTPVAEAVPASPDPGAILRVARFFHDPRGSMRAMLQSGPGEARLMGLEWKGARASGAGRNCGPCSQGRSGRSYWAGRVRPNPVGPSGDGSEAIESLELLIVRRRFAPPPSGGTGRIVPSPALGSALADGL